MWQAAEGPPQSRRRHTSPGLTTGSPSGLLCPRRLFHARCERWRGSPYRVCGSLIDSTAALGGLPSAASPTAASTADSKEDPAPLSQIIERLNERFSTDSTDSDRLVLE